MIVNRRRYMGASGGGGLPYDAEVEYLSFPGTSGKFILTNVIPTSYNYKFYVKARSDAGNIFILSMNVQYGVLNINYYPQAVYPRFFGNNQTNYSVTQDIHEIEMSADGLWIDGEKKGNVNTPSAPNIANNTAVVCLGGRPTTAVNPTAADYIFQGQVQAFKIWETNSNTLLVDWKAVRVGTAGYMYDNITGQMLTAYDGTTFNVGSDKTT